MNNPEFVKIDEELYPINTDFRVAIQCNEISMNETIGDNEKMLAIIYKLFGDKGLDDNKHHERLFELAEKYLNCGQERTINKKDIEPDMDFVQDMDYIEASFMSDYNIDLANTEMHWWKFYNLLCGLSNSEFGNCCVLNRVRNLRNLDLKEIDDPKKRQEMADIKESIALKKKQKPKEILNNKQKENIDNFYKMTGIKRKE